MNPGAAVTVFLVVALVLSWVLERWDRWRCARRGHLRAWVDPDRCARCGDDLPLADGCCELFRHWNLQHCQDCPRRPEPHA